MRIALLPSSFHPHVGGVEEVALQLAHEQVRRGDAPLIVTNRWPKTLPSREIVEGLTVSRLNFRVPERTLRQLGGAGLCGVPTLWRLLRVLRSHRADLLHVHCVSSNAYYALWAKRLTGLPLVVTLHAELTMDATGLFQRSKFAQRLMRRTLREADVVTACSARTLDDAERFYGEPLRPKARVIYNGVAMNPARQEQGKQPERPYVFAIGRMVRQKGFDVLLRAYSALRQQGVASHDLWLAGLGAEEPELQRLAAELGLNGSVRFLGTVDRAQAGRLFAGCALHVVPSRCDEGLPMVLLESMSAGKPVVASRVGGIPEIVAHQDTGLLVERENVDALTVALASLLQSPDRMERMGNAALAKSRNFSWPAIAADYDSAYQRALAGHAAVGWSLNS